MTSILCDGGCINLMLECLSRIEHRLPQVGRGAIDAARRAHSGAGSWLELGAERQRCWSAIDMLAVTTAHAREIDGLRAVLFVLGPPGQEDLVEALDLFVRFANRVEPHYAELEPILRRHFGTWLTAANL